MWEPGDMEARQGDQARCNFAARGQAHDGDAAASPSPKPRTVKLEDLVVAFPGVLKGRDFGIANVSADAAVKHLLPNRQGLFAAARVVVARHEANRFVRLEALLVYAEAGCVVVVGRGGVVGGGAWWDAAVWTAVPRDAKRPRG